MGAVKPFCYRMLVSQKEKKEQRKQNLERGEIVSDVEKDGKNKVGQTTDNHEPGAGAGVGAEIDKKELPP